MITACLSHAHVNSPPRSHSALQSWLLIYKVTNKGCVVCIPFLSWRLSSLPLFSCRCCEPRWFFAGKQWCNSKVPPLCLACTGESFVSCAHCLPLKLNVTRSFSGLGTQSHGNIWQLRTFRFCLLAQINVMPSVSSASRCSLSSQLVFGLHGPAVKITRFSYPFFPIFPPGELPMRGISFLTNNKWISFWVSDTWDCPKVFWKT